MNAPFQLAATAADHAIMGIDPGVTGGIAFLYGDGTIAAQHIPTVAGEVDVATLARTVRSFAPRAVVIEHANAFPGQGVSSVFKFGLAYGALRAMVMVLEIPLYTVHAGRWKNHFKLDSDKEKARALAIRMWPAGSSFFSRKKDHGPAEAALIARYGQDMIAGLGRARAASSRVEEINTGLA